MSDDTVSPAPEPILVLVRDMIFSSRIAAEARAAGANFQMIGDPNALGATPGRKLIVDLNLQGATEAASAWQKTTGRPVVGFVSHADTHAIAQARQAGIDPVLARSRFVQVLPDLLKG
jgi:hypothetical protein